jgi:hypothetical protein
LVSEANNSVGEEQMTSALRVMTISSKGGVGKTFTALQILQAFKILGRNPSKMEVERPTGRKFSAVLNVSDADSAVTYVPLPSPAQLSENASLQARAYAPALRALRQTKEDIIIDCAADATGAILEAAELAEHGAMSNDGEGIMLVIVAKMADATSLAFAEEAAVKARQIWAKAHLVGVITHVSGDGAKSDAERLASSVDAVVAIDLIAAPSMLKLYAADDMSTAKIAEMSVPGLYKLLEDEVGVTEESVAIERGRLKKWRITTEKRMVDLLLAPRGMQEATDAAAADPREPAGAS